MSGACESVKVRQKASPRPMACRHLLRLAAAIALVAACFTVDGPVAFAAGAAGAAADGGQGGPGPAPPTSEPTTSAAGPAAPRTPDPDITFMEEDEEPRAAAPKNPFAGEGGAAGRRDAVPGCVELSSAEKVPGRIYTTRARRIRIFNLEREIYEDVPVPAILKIEAIVEWERVDKEWRFKEAGNPEKIYTGRSCPVRQLTWRLTLRGGHQIVGHILGQPLYVDDGGKPRQFILHMRDKGPMGSELKDLVYVRRIEFGPEAYDRAVGAKQVSPR